MKRSVVSFLALLVTIILLLTVYVNKQYIKDQYVVRTAELQPAAGVLMKNLDLTSEGIFFYKASQPKVQTSNQFNNSCGNVVREHSIVLGCYTKQRLFVFDITDQRLSGVEEVTAAHEMLHAAYERLSAKEKASIDEQLKIAAASIEDQRFKDTLAEYERTEPKQIENELHSILGTEIAVLPSGLEEYYRRYFNDRDRIVAYANQYAKTFTDIDAQIKSFDATLTSLNEQKNVLESTVKTLKLAIDRETVQLNTLRNSGDTESYNRFVPGYNQKINEYNNTINELKSLVEDYNNVVKQRNDLATTQNELVQQLDSNYSTLQ